jgi:hypothetical protein
MDESRAITAMINLRIDNCRGARRLFRMSTLIWAPDFSNGPRSGKTSQLVRIGGSSMNQS